jgi:hypothetical protein
VKFSWAPGRLLLLLLSVLPGMSAASEMPVVQVAVEPAVVNVGEPVTLTIAVFTPTWFPQPPVFPSFELPNTITRLPPNSSGPVSQRVDRSTWSGVQRRYQIFPLIGGQFRIHGRTLSLTYADPQSTAPVAMELAIPDLVFDSQVPPGAQDLDPYLAGHMLELRRVVEADTDGLNAGDALVIHYRAELEGLPSLFLPPLANVPPQDGLSVYAAEPVFSDEAGSALRDEKVTLVFDQGGEYVLPALQLPWWNLRTQTVEVAELDALTIAVSGSAGTDEVAAEGSSSAIVRWLLPLALLAAIALALLRRPVKAMLEARRSARARYLSSEEYAFECLQQALKRGGDLKSCYNQLLRWLALLDDQQDLDGFARSYGDSTLPQDLLTLRARLFSDAASAPDLKQLARSLHSARDAWRKANTADRQSSLPLLNP